RTGACADNERQDAGVDRDVLLFAQRLEVLLEHARRNQPERIVVRARPNGADDLFRLSGRKDKLHMRWWLFDDLQQCVEALSGDHVRFVNDVDLVARNGWRVEGLVAQLPGVVDTTVAGGVDLDDVYAAWPSAREVLAALTFTARLGGRTLLAVQAA